MRFQNFEISQCRYPIPPSQSIILSLIVFVTLVYICFRNLLRSIHTDQIIRSGTSSGFGRELVKSAVARGDLVIATARSLEKIQDFEHIETVRTLQLDVTEGLSSIKAKVDQAAGYFGRIDVLVNNAGQGFKTILEEGGYVWPLLLPSLLGDPRRTLT